MARVDYYAIQEAIKTVLDADANLSGVTVVLEEDEFLIEQTPWIGIYLLDRNKDGESIAAGTRQHFDVRYELWCVEHHPETVRQAAEARDDLIGNAEVALMGNRNLSGTLAAGVALEIESGEFETARSQAGFVMAGSIIVRVIATATT